MNRYFMTVDIDGEFRQLEIPQHVVEIIKADEREKCIHIANERMLDLLCCHKADQCHTKAEGIELAIDDIKVTAAGGGGQTWAKPK